MEMKSAKKNSLKSLAMLVFTALFYTSCTDTTEVGLEGKVNVMVVNAIPTDDSIDFYLDSARFTPLSLGFREYMPYDSVAGGRRSAEIMRAGENAFALSKNLYLNPYRNYSFFITHTDSLNTDLSYVATVDNLVEPSLGTSARLRFIHLSPDEKGVDLYTQRDTFALTKTFSNAYFKSASVFQDIRAGNYRFLLTPVGSTEEIVSVSNLVLLPKKSYTLFISGFKAASDDKSLRISLIQNN